MTSKHPREVTEELARREGTFTDEFMRKAEEEAENGRKGMLQATESGEEIREDLREAVEIYVSIECNEKGFSRTNIEAICRRGQSTKAPGQGYTGEKGIGFKSIFKFANRTHIRSGPYYLELDHRRDLSMFTPQWDEDFFEKHEKKYQTTIILERICNESKDSSSAFKIDVDAVDPVLILFLRRIVRLHLTLYKSRTDHKPVISKRFRHVDWTPDSGIESLKDEDTNRMRRFY
ncbi:hypothetical protein P153DRAFT_361929 [Dothidotthia symphoricarpi CBS 119687]|uniref:Uncharacterized protein n=1 Tax=Dothidotthia symphoricarpi CBS 119687 TaxID=1392245 RepID=A0A6A5ZXK6_9PLEO|nr:uncharacterized protein P153DRAFT_361929 [Dothidotthia symphoricarpi CBS 119687]KAF2123507.1 hypothetical protein P153DRAFT_361929 [Dothidotthia symphoricarpi CBS 119687]